MTTSNKLRIPTITAKTSTDNSTPHVAVSVSNLREEHTRYKQSNSNTSITVSSKQDHPCRSSSFRVPNDDSNSSEPSHLSVEKTSIARVRRNSVPSVNCYLNVPECAPSSGLPEHTNECKIRRVRSFKTTAKGGVVNRGDSFKKKSTHSLRSTGNAICVDENHSSGIETGTGNDINGRMMREIGVTPTYFRVNMMGYTGVGKTSLAKQFLTSESVDQEDMDDNQPTTVTVLLDGDESTIEIVDTPYQNLCTQTATTQDHIGQLFDAYVVVYAINDLASFHAAHDLVSYLRVEFGTDRAILLVANKVDLVRKRKVTEDGAHLVATMFDCQYVETSAALNHHVDELLVGIISQVRLQLEIPFTTIFFPNKESRRHGERGKHSFLKGPRRFFAKLFCRSTFRLKKGVNSMLDY